MAGLVTCLLAAVAWFTLWIPLVNVGDPRWLRSHSDAEVCEEIDRVRSIWGWRHDMSILVGSCDPEWVGRILSDAGTSEYLISTNVDLHLGTSLQRLTGQSIAEHDLAAWRRWYAEHSDESQDRWFRDAFASAGIDLPAEFTSDDVRRLLEWIGAKQPNVGPPVSVAFRLLRDQQAMTELVANGPDGDLNPVQVLGLRRYLTWNAKARYKNATSDVVMPLFRAGPPLALVLIGLVSAFLLGRSWRQADPS